MASQANGEEGSSRRERVFSRKNPLRGGREKVVEPLCKPLYSLSLHFSALDMLTPMKGSTDFSPHATVSSNLSAGSKRLGYSPCLSEVVLSHNRRSCASLAYVLTYCCINIRGSTKTVYMHYDKRRLLWVTVNVVKKYILPSISTTSNALRRPPKRQNKVV